jgi:uncharacterized protein Yka (UPF0111/DUF47 family)
MFKRLLPRETSFFDFFEQHSKLSVEACKELDAITVDPTQLLVHADRIKQIEREADGITYQCIDALHRTFITPFDRADIHRLIKRLDDITDAIDSASSRMAIYQLTESRPEVGQLTRGLMRATVQIDSAVINLRHLSKRGDAIGQCCQAVYEAEKEGDQILRTALGRLFREEKDAIKIIKWKEVFERLEKASDRCEEVANIIQGVVIEAS